MVKSVTVMLVVVAFAGLFAAGCKDARCEANPVGAPWKKYESLLPDQAVVCGPNRISSKKSSAVDNYPPTHVFVFYEERNPAGAMLATIKKFEAAGWKVSPEPPIGKGDSAIYSATATKDGVTIKFDVNRNDWGTQGSFKLNGAAGDLTGN